MEIVVCVDSSLMADDLQPAFGKKIIDKMKENEDKLAGKVRICITNNSIDEDRSIEIFIKDRVGTIVHQFTTNVKDDLFRTARSPTTPSSSGQPKRWLTSCRLRSVWTTLPGSRA